MPAAPSLTWLAGAPRRRDAVVIPADRLAWPFALFLAEQIDRLEPGRNFDIIVAVDARNAPVPKVRGDVAVVAFPPDPRIEALPRTWSISHASYGWVFLPELLDGYRRLLFLDADLWQRRGGLGALFGDAPLSRPLAAAPSRVEFVPRGDAPSYLHRRDGLDPAQIHRNSGVVLIETAAYVAGGFARRLIETRAALGRSILSNDQVALNRIGGEIALLSPIWNFEIRFGQLDEAERFDPVLVHFTNHPKPWVHTPGFPDWPQYAAYRSFLDERFDPSDLRRHGLWGDRPARPPGPAAALRHAFARHKLDRSNRRKRAQQDSNVPRADFDQLARLCALADL